MKAKTLFVAAADEAYFPLLKGLILSIHEHQPDARRPIGVLNLGMTPPQLDELAIVGLPQSQLPRGILIFPAAIRLHPGCER
jgi:hypothetical protein